MGSGALRLGCNWHEKNPARQGGRGCRLSLPGSACFQAHLPHPRRAGVPVRFYAPPYGGGVFYGKSVRPIMSDGFYGERCALCKRYLA